MRNSWNVVKICCLLVKGIVAVNIKILWLKSIIFKQKYWILIRVLNYLRKQNRVKLEKRIFRSLKNSLKIKKYVSLSLNFPIIYKIRRKHIFQ